MFVILVCGNHNDLHLYTLHIYIYIYLYFSYSGLLLVESTEESQSPVKMAVSSFTRAS